MSELDTNLNSNPQESQGQNTSAETETTTTSTDNEKTTYTREEVLELIQKESDRRVTQALEKAQRKSKAAEAEALKLARMNEQEKYEYSLKMKEEELAKRERDILLLENKAEASKILAEKGLSLTFLDFVVSETAEEMNDRINIINRAFKESVRQEVERRLGSNTPKAPSTPSGQMTKEQFKNLSLAQKQELYRSDRELYNSLTN